MSITVNSYFEGKVQSLGFVAPSGKATVGVMVAGEYEFGTGAPELMTLVEGAWELKLPGSDSFKPFAKGETASIPGDSKFQLKILVDSAYLCQFV